MYNVIQIDESVNASSIVAECETLQEAEHICKEARKTWEETYIEEEKVMKNIFIDKLKNSLKDRFDYKLIDELEKGGFFTAPCSTQYHLAKEEGLLEHSLNVTSLAEDIGKLLGFEDEKLDSLIVCALLHDVGKMGQFGKANYIENILKSGEQSKSKPYTSNSELMYVPHEIRSLQIIGKYIDLTEEESFAILHHNGMYGDLKYTLQGKETPMQMILHFADMWASRVMEKEG